MSFLNLFKKLKLWKLKNKILKIEHKKIFRGPSKILKNISWPINICLKYFMAPTKTLRPPSYILNVRSRTKGVLANETTVNYDTKTKACKILARSLSYQKGRSSWKNRFKKQSFSDFKLGVLKNFENSTGKNLCWSVFLKSCRPKALQLY